MFSLCTAEVEDATDGFRRWFRGDSELELRLESSGDSAGESDVKTSGCRKGSWSWYDLLSDNSDGERHGGFDSATVREDEARENKSSKSCPAFSDENCSLAVSKKSMSVSRYGFTMSSSTTIGSKGGKVGDEVEPIVGP